MRWSTKRKLEEIGFYVDTSFSIALPSLMIIGNFLMFGFFSIIWYNIMDIDGANKFGAVTLAICMYNVLVWVLSLVAILRDKKEEAKKKSIEW